MSARPLNVSLSSLISRVPSGETLTERSPSAKAEAVALRSRRGFVSRLETK